MMEPTPNVVPRVPKKKRPPPGGLFSGVEVMDNKLDDEVEAEVTAEKQRIEMELIREELDFVDDYFNSPVSTMKSLPRPFQIHLAIALVVSVSLFFVFHFVYKEEVAAPERFQWWIYPWFLFAMTLTGHHFFTGEKKWTGFVIINVILHVALFIINKELTPSFDWFWYSLIISVMIMLAYYYSFDPKTSRLTTASYLYCLVNVLVFITWLNFHSWTSFPWFIYFVFGLALPLLGWYLYEVYQEKRKWVYCVVLSVPINVMALLTWGFTFPKWPWFLVVFGTTAALSVAAYFVERKAILPPYAPAGSQRTDSVGIAANRDPIEDEYDFAS
eukprot:TRINITY_DN2242_c0_g1_i1.p1 TRINITY_DN2242_c0_g1~~TRINITY_DN2242_c0_g1_i1.p1  ORF type:complete len:352 (+),score=46.13 TRINITY_DN2242_c0_g1_i1:72-1058(+)